MVPRAGIEPACFLKREILSLLCLPISPSRFLQLLSAILPICQRVISTDKRIAVISGPVPRTVRPA